MRLVFFGPGVSAGLRGVRQSKPHPLNRSFRRVLVDFRLSRLCWLEGGGGPRRRGLAYVLLLALAGCAWLPAAVRTGEMAAMEFL